MNRVPKVLRSDNGPLYDGQTFRYFAKEYDFKHITSSSHFPQSNGFIESHVKTIKNTLKKAQQTKTDPYLALLCLRGTPIDNKLSTAAELLLGRPIQDNLPRKIQRDRTSQEIIERLGERQKRQKHYFDRQRHQTTSRQPINIQEPTTLVWKAVVIKESIPSLPRSYTVTTPERVSLRRNRQQIKEAPAPTKYGEVQPQQDQSVVTNDSNPQVNHCMTRSGQAVRRPLRYGFLFIVELLFVILGRKRDIMICIFVRI